MSITMSSVGASPPTTKVPDWFCTSSPDQNPAGRTIGTESMLPGAAAGGIPPSTSHSPEYVPHELPDRWMVMRRSYRLMSDLTVWRLSRPFPPRLMISTSWKARSSAHFSPEDTVPCLNRPLDGDETGLTVNERLDSLEVVSDVPAPVDDQDELEGEFVSPLRSPGHCSVPEQLTVVRPTLGCSDYRIDVSVGTQCGC